MESDLCERLAGALFRMRPSSHQFSKEMNIAKGEFMLLWHIGIPNRFAGDLTVSDIQKKLGLTMPAISQMLKNLESKNLIERSVDKNDRRRVIVKVMPEGEKILEEMKNSIDQTIGEAIARMGEQQCEQLITLILKFANIMEEIGKEQRERTDDT